MKKLLIVTLILFIIGCKNDDKHLSSNLYDIIINYQKKVPIPSEKEVRERTPIINPSKAKYVYQLTFDIIGKDSIVSIQLANGILTKNNMYGEYSSNFLKPLIIVDEKKIGVNFVKKYIRNNIENYILKTPPTLDEIYPLYRYKINNNKLILKDSIMGNALR